MDALFEHLRLVLQLHVVEYFAVEQYPVDPRVEQGIEVLLKLFDEQLSAVVRDRAGERALTSSGA